MKKREEVRIELQYLISQLQHRICDLDNNQEENLNDEEVKALELFFSEVDLTKKQID
jgi:hypothetical protein